MTDYKPSEIDEAVAANKVADEWGDSDGGWNDLTTRSGIKQVVLRGETVTVKRVDARLGDSEDSGYGTTSVWMVVEVGTQFFRKLGDFSSHGGYVWDSARKWDDSIIEVNPVDETVTVYNSDRLAG